MTIADRHRPMPSPAVRMPYSANLKSILVAWVIGGHALVSYSRVGGWAYDEVNEVTFHPMVELALTMLVGASGLFVIGVFFFIAGLHAPGSLQRKGAGHYSRERLVRLGLPFLVSAVLIWPLSVWFAYRAAGWHVSPWWIFVHRQPFLDSGALWFAEVLLIYSLAFAGWHVFVRPKPLSESPRPIRVPQLAVLTVLLIFTTFVLRLWFPARSGQTGDLHLWQWPECIAMFALGIAAARRNWTVNIPDATYKLCGAIAVMTIAIVPLLAISAGVTDPVADIDPFLGGWRWQALMTSAIESTLVVACSVWFVGLAQRRLNSAAQWTATLSRAAFAAFTLQGPVLLTLSTTLRPLALPAEVKALAVGVGAIVGCFWLGHLIVDHSKLGKFL